MSTYAEQISAFENKRAANLAAMERIMAKAADEGATLDAEQQEEFDNLQADNEAIDSHLKRLRTLEKEAAAKAVPAAGNSPTVASQSRAGVVTVQRSEKLAPGIAFARFAKVKALSRLDGERPRDVARSLYGENSQVYGMFVKAAVAAGTTTDETWAGPLVGEETSAFADFVEYLRPQTILGRFGTEGVPSRRGEPARSGSLALRREQPSLRHVREGCRGRRHDHRRHLGRPARWRGDFGLCGLRGVPAAADHPRSLR